MNVWYLVFVLLLILLAVGLIWLFLARPVNQYPSKQGASCGVIRPVPILGATFLLENINTTSNMWWSFANNQGIFTTTRDSATPITYDRSGRLIVASSDDTPTYMTNNNGSLEFTTAPNGDSAVWYFNKGQVMTANHDYLLSINNDLKAILIPTNQGTPTSCGFVID